jgi:DNA modification methylase
VLATFERWTNSRILQSLGTNWGAQRLPFQDWRRFKEAFAPELVARAIRESRIAVHSCLDPFGGSGTTALASQFLGVHPTTIEVNPFLADLIEAKLTKYDSDQLARDLGTVLRRSRPMRASAKELFQEAPETFLEPGVNNRWIFDRAVARRIAAILAAINELRNRSHRRLFRVILGGILIDLSNVITSGKGRRYRQNWKERRCDPHSVDLLFADSVGSAIEEIHRYSRRKCSDYTMIRGDARSALDSVQDCELAVFSPPYPNSFDYTDVYNVELWTLGYLTGRRSNHRLRHATLTSHVQIKRDFAKAPTTSKTLGRVLKSLERARPALWNRWIPEMVGAYFADMLSVLGAVHRKLARDGSVWIVAGDSQYAAIRIRTTTILTELAHQQGWAIDGIEPFRSMRSSAQQGRESALRENLIVLSKR